MVEVDDKGFLRPAPHPTPKAQDPGPAASADPLGS